MEAFFEKFQHDLKVFSFKEIKSITGDFDKGNLIGEGGFGKVYKGVVESNSKGQIMAAFKRLDSSCGQGNPEFMKEITMLSHYKHDNLIILLGYCDENHEKILVYEYAAHGSLDGHLSSTTLSWTQRLEICLGAARGLCYLHDPLETHQRIIHRDIKSSNVLLDENWNAKISDLGLSKIGPANQVQSFLATNIVGTFFYADPEYMETSIITKESDVYSFGVVLFEVLCGSLCFENKNGQFQRLVRKWTKSYKHKKLEEIIFHHLKQGMDPKSLETFSEIAYGCLQKSRDKRPNMSHVVEKLEIALHLQQEFSKMEREEMVKAAVTIEELEMLFSKTFPINESSKLEFKEIVKAAIKEKELEMRISQRFLNREISEREFEKIVEVAVSKEELQMLVSKRFINKEKQELFLSKGVLVNGGKTWFSSNKNGGQCEMISGDCCDFTSTLTYCHHIGFRTVDVKSRFKVRSQDMLYTGFETHARTQFLSPGITYTVHLVFKLEHRLTTYKYLKYKFAGETEFLTSFIVHEREDGWMMSDQLCSFTCTNENVDLDIIFVDCGVPLLVEGIEIRSLEKVQHEQVFEEEEDTYRAPKLRKDWRKILNFGSSKDIGEPRTKEELNFILSKGVIINHGREYFSLANNGKYCHMLSAREISGYLRCDWKSSPNSRFGETACDPVGQFYIKFISIMLSPQTTYAAYLVYKLQENHPRFESPVEVHINNLGVDSTGCYIYLLGHQPPIVDGKLYQKKRFPQQRNDGWMEVPVYEFQTDTDARVVAPGGILSFELKTSDNVSLKGIIVEGIELRPV